MKAQELIDEEKNLHGLLVNKLSTVIDSVDVPSWFVNLAKCGSVMGWKECADCRTEDPLVYRCSQKWCPRCNWRITVQRAEKLRVWSKEIRNPMHLVLTQKNFKVISSQLIKANVENIAKLRRRDVMDKVKGGCVSVEATNSVAEGWHLHSHWLVDARFVDMKELAIEWANLVGQHFAIVHYNNSKEKSFVQEVCKYVAKPAEMLAWTAVEIHDFITACRGRRFFFVFGSLFHEGKRIRNFIEESTGKEPCTCSACRSPAVRIRASSHARAYERQKAVAKTREFETPMRRIF